MKYSQIEYCLQVFALLLLLTLVFFAITSQALEISMYQIKGSDRTVIECTYDENKTGRDNRLPDRLVVKNRDLETEAVIKWFDTICLRK